MADKAKEVVPMKLPVTDEELAATMTKTLDAGKKATPVEALKAVMSPSEVLARPHDYEKWYNGMREEALNG